MSVIKVWGVPKKYFDALTSLATILGIISGMWAVYLYVQQIEAARAEKTLELVEVWSNGPARSAYRRLDAEMSGLIDAMSDQDRAEVAAASTEERIEKRQQLGLKAIQNHEVFDALEEVEFFFNRLAICVDTQLCSRYVAEAFFKDTLETLLAAYGAAIEQRQHNGWPSFGASTQRLSASF